MPTEDTAPGTDELRGDGWRRLLAAARRRLERTGGHLAGEIGLTKPSDAERRTVIGITGRYRPESAGRLTVPLHDLDAYLHHRYGTGLHQTLTRIGGPLRDRPAERADENARREDESGEGCDGSAQLRVAAQLAAGLPCHEKGEQRDGSVKGRRSGNGSRAEDECKDRCSGVMPRDGIRSTVHRSSVPPDLLEASATADAYPRVEHP